MVVRERQHSIRRFDPRLCVRCHSRPRAQGRECGKCKYERHREKIQARYLRTYAGPRVAITECLDCQKAISDRSRNSIRCAPCQKAKKAARLKAYQQRVIAAKAAATAV